MEFVIVWAMVELLLALILVVATAFISAVFFEAYRRKNNNAYVLLSTLQFSSSLIPGKD